MASKTPGASTTAHQYLSYRQVSEGMHGYLASMAVSLAVSACLTPLVRPIALRLGAVSLPGGRNTHRGAIPRLGGVAIAAAATVPIVGWLVLKSDVHRVLLNNWLEVAGCLLGGATICCVGAVDDVRSLRAHHKLLAQLVVGLLAFACNFRIEAIYVPAIGELSMGVFALPVTMLWIVGITNAINLIDGLDGLAAGVVLFASITNFAVALLRGDVFVAVFMAAIIGSLLGFLLYNFNPARIFMGDSGSYFLGYTIAILSLAGSTNETTTAVSLLVPIVALGVPIFDTLLSMMRRAVQRRPLMSADRGHIHHKLLDLGLTQRRAVLVIYLVCLTLTVSAIALSLNRSWETGVSLVVASGVMFCLVHSVGCFRQLIPTTTPGLCARAEAMRPHFVDLQERLFKVEDADTLRSQLVELGERLELASIELIAPDKSNQILFCWENPVSTVRNLVSAEFFIGTESSSRASIRYSWGSDDSRASPYVVMQLQLLTDALALRCQALTLLP